MEFFKHFALGIKNYYKAVRFIIAHKLYWYFPIPALLMLGIYFVGNQALTWQSTWSEQLGCLECETMNDTIWFVLKLLLSITVGLILMKFAKYIVVVLLSPMISLISQKVETILTGKKYPFDFNQTLHDVQRGIQIAFRNVMWEYFFFLIILIFSFIGWDDPKASPIFYLTFVIGFFYYGFSFIDYVNERRRLDIDQSIFFVRNHRGLAVAIGSIYSIFILVPVDLGVMFDFSNFGKAPLKQFGIIALNMVLWFLASIAPILAIVSATLSMHDIVDLNNNKYSVKVTEKRKDE
ncbi:CysZ protein [Lishizhenia tianjinensis]|uniref:CysZ protein n=1 Tax=Lishizhenia tianjinensis TaxID=477690 RepID=A0A1I7BNB1_9FLAO|nr:EI24 domain-containing protein [Lishizhenia tianjinensis]SFT88667.1 CysZ protein [Lishizhenia tianjinensis]